MNIIEKAFEQIEKISEEFGVNISLLEKHLAALKYGQQIQEFDKRLILYGGTAAQFYLPKEAQRTSTDVDLITNLREEEVNKVINEFCKYHSINPLELSKRELGTDYGVGYGFPFDFKHSPKGPFPHKVKIEIASRIKEKLKPETEKNCLLYGVPIGKFIMLSDLGIFVKKIVTLDLGNTGLQYHRDDLATKVAKHVYDLSQIASCIDKQKFEQLPSMIYEQLRGDIDHQKKMTVCSENDCMKNLISIFSELGEIDLLTKLKNPPLFRKGFKNIKIFLPENVRNKLILPDWGEFGWTMEHLLTCAMNDSQKGKNDFVKQHLSLADNLSEEKPENKKLKPDLIKDLLDHKVPKTFKHRSILSLACKKECIEGII